MKNYFINAKNLVGIEYQPNIVYKKDGVKIIYSDVNDIHNVNSQLGDMKFDIIIDDGSHNIEDQIFAFEYLKDRLNPNGLYVIDVGPFAPVAPIVVNVNSLKVGNNSIDTKPSPEQYPSVYVPPFAVIDDLY